MQRFVLISLATHFPGMSGKTGRASKSGLGGKRKSIGGKPKGSFKKNFKRQKVLHHFAGPFHVRIYSALHQVLTKDEKKELAKERKAAKPHAALVKEANKIFDEPIKALQKGQQQERIQVILDSCQGKLVVLAAKRDTSRVLQRAIKYGSKPQRSQLAAEFKGRLAHLAGERYGHFVVTKLLEYGNEEIKVRLETLTKCFALSTLMLTSAAHLLAGMCSARIRG